MKVIFATGRSFQTNAVPRDWFDGYVCCNGAYASDGKTLVYQRTFSKETTQFILDICKKRGITAEPRQNEEVCLPDMKPGDADYLNLLLPTNLHLIITDKNYGQIVHKEATKAKAAEALAQYWAIDKTDVAAFGDDLNDTGILSWAGIGIAMGNALDEVKAIADEICLDNDDDGIADWIEKKIFEL